MSYGRLSPVAYVQRARVAASFPYSNGQGAKGGSRARAIAHYRAVGTLSTTAMGPMRQAIGIPSATPLMVALSVSPTATEGMLEFTCSMELATLPAPSAGRKTQCDETCHACRPRPPSECGERPFPPIGTTSAGYARFPTHHLDSGMSLDGWTRLICHSISSGGLCESAIWAARQMMWQ